MLSVRFRLAVVVLLIAAFTSCGFTPNPKLVSLTADPVTVIRGQSQQITVVARYSNGTVTTVTGAIFSSSDTSLASVSSAGLLTGVSVGNGTINFTFQGVVGSVSFSVERHLVSVSLPDGSVPRGQSVGLILIGHYDDSTTTTMTDVTWASSNPAVAAISSSGVLTGVFAGTVTVTASSGGMQTSGAWQVTAPASGTADSSGGTIDSTGTPIPGVTIVIPAGALDEPATIAIDTETTPPGALDPSALAVSAVWVLEKDVPYNFNQPVTVTIPVDVSQLAADDIPLVLYWSPYYSKYLASSTVDYDPAAGTLTFQTSHFSKFLPVAVRGIWSAGQVTSIATKFRPDVDGFFHPNFGSYDSTGGSSFGMSLYSIWYFGQKAQADGTTLYNKYREGDPTRWQDDATARELISRLYLATSSHWAKLASDDSGEKLKDANTVKQLWSALQTTGQPQLLLLRGTSWTQAVVVYAWDFANGQFSIYDPNFPGEIVTLAYSPSGGFGAYSKAAAYSDAIRKVVFRSIGDAVDGSEFETLYQGAETGFATGYPQVTITSPTLDTTGTAILTDGSQGVTLEGTATGGSPAPTHVVVYVQGTKAGVVALGSGGSFRYTIASALQATTNIKFVATSNPKDSWNPNAAYAEATVKVQGQAFVANAGFESGDWTGWTHETHTWWDSTPGSSTPEKSAIVNALDGNNQTLFDAVDTSLPQVYTGNHAARVNNEDSNYHISTATQTVTVPNISNPQIRFYWAAVLEDPQHDAANQPYVDIQVVDLSVMDPNTSQPTVLYYKHFYSNDPTYSGWKTINSYYYYNWKVIQWQPVVLSLGGAIGHQVQIKVTAADCGYGGHGGYVYLDGDEQ